MTQAKAFSAIRWTTVSSLSKALLQLAQVSVLARFLTAEDFGNVAILYFFLGLATVFSEFGLNSAMVQAREVTDFQRSSIFWLNLAFSIFIVIVLFSLSSYLAAYFGSEELRLLISLASPIFVLNALSLDVKVSAEKKLNFKPVVIVEITSALLGLSVSVVAAVLGYGALAIVIGGSVTAAISMLGMWVFLSDGWRPRFVFSFDETRPFLKFGGLVVFSNIINQINLGLDIFLGARTVGAAQLGVYSLPRNLALQIQFIINPIVTRVGFPLLACAQGDTAEVRRLYSKTMNMTASVNMPLYAGLALFSTEVVSLIFGSSWLQSGKVLVLLACWGGARSLLSPVGGLLTGVGKAGVLFKWNLIVTILLLPVLYFGSKEFGAEGLAAALFLFTLGLIIPAWFFLVNPVCGIELITYLKLLVRPALLACASAIVGHVVALPFDHSILRLIFGGGGMAGCYLMLSYYFNREWFDSICRLIFIRFK